MELAGVAADIADAGSHTSNGGLRPTRGVAGPHAAAAAAAPLRLFGCVGEGTPSDAMAEEALRLWVGVSRAPPRSWGPLLLTMDDRGAGGDDTPAAPAAGMDGPVLKAVFCASDAIRAQLARSLLLVCGGVGTAAAEAAAEAAAGRASSSSSANDHEAIEAAGEGAGAPPLPAATSSTPAVAARRQEGTAAAATATESEAARNDLLREHVVRLLLDNIPRSVKSGDGATAGGRAPASGGKEEHGPAASAAAVSRAGRRRRRETRRKDKDCTQLFEVLCALVEKSIKLAADQGRAGGLGGESSSSAAAAVAGPKRGRLDVNALAANVVERLLAHPCTERRGAREEDKDTLLVRREK